MSFLSKPIEYKISTKNWEYRQELLVKHSYFGDSPCPCVEWKMPEDTEEVLGENNIRYQLKPGKMVLGLESALENDLEVSVELEVTDPLFWHTTALDENNRPDLGNGLDGFIAAIRGNTIGILTFPLLTQNTRLIQFEAFSYIVEYHLPKVHAGEDDLEGDYTGHPFTNDELVWTCELVGDKYHIRSSNSISLRKPQKANFKLRKDGETFYLPIPDFRVGSEKIRTNGEILQIDLKRLPQKTQ